MPSVFENRDINISAVIRFAGILGFNGLFFIYKLQMSHTTIGRPVMELCVTWFRHCRHVSIRGQERMAPGEVCFQCILATRVNNFFRLVKF